MLMEGRERPQGRLIIVAWVREGGAEWGEEGEYERGCQWGVGERKGRGERGVVLK